MNIVSKIEHITPIRADQLLVLNKRNRPLNQRYVNQLANDMRAGRWEANGESIKLNGSELLDGQHRLHAIKQSGVTVPVLVVSGIKKDAYTTIDTGRARTPSDALKMAGEKHTTRLGAALKIIDQIDNGFVTSKHSKRTSHGELFSVLDRHPDLRKSTGLFLDGKKLLPPAVIVAFHYKFAQKDPTQAYEFFDKLLSGEGLVRGNPIHTLREKLIRNSSSHTKYSRDNIMIFTIMAWNAHRQGKQLLKIYVPSNPGLPSIL
jgi:hypothetical protein